IKISVLRKPEVKKFLGIPIVPVTPPSTNQKPTYSFFESLKKYADAQQEHHHQSSSSSSSSPSETSSKPANTKISSSSVLSQRIRSLEREIKGRKKGKKM
ncbi:hypothetical protein PHJA_002943500, partial [Phtheirospermum japonicum]